MGKRRRSIRIQELDFDIDRVRKLLPNGLAKKNFDDILFTMENIYYNKGYEEGWKDSEAAKPMRKISLIHSHQPLARGVSIV